LGWTDFLNIPKVALAVFKKNLTANGSEIACRIIRTVKEVGTALALLATGLSAGAALACTPPPAGSAPALALEAQAADTRRTAVLVVEGRWHYSRAALLADKRMDARLAAEPPGGTKIKHHNVSYAILIPTKLIRGKARAAHKVWYSRLNQTCPSDGPAEGAQGTFYITYNPRFSATALWLGLFDQAGCPDESRRAPFPGMFCHFTSQQEMKR
jgi:hypothetical protein